MYYKIHIQPSEKVAKMFYDELRFMSNYYYDNPPQNEQQFLEEQEIRGELNYISDNCHT